MKSYYKTNYYLSLASQSTTNSKKPDADNLK